MKGDIELQLSMNAGLVKWDYAMVAAGTIVMPGKAKPGWKILSRLR